MKKMIFILVVILSFSFTYLPVSSEVDIELTPENTVILSNNTDESFCKDFSAYLRRVSLDWIAVEKFEHVKDRNLIILGGPDAEGTGNIVREVITPEEADHIRKNGRYSTLEKGNPWTDNRVIYICAGSDRVFTKKAAEEGITLIMEKVQDPEKWMCSPFFNKSPQDVQEYIAQFRFIPDDKELPKDQIGIEADAEISRYISSEAAAEDVEYLFYLLSHGYSGYGYFKTKGDFDQAKKNILKRLETRSTWSTKDFSALIYEHLNFVHDGHFRVGYHHYFTYNNFWYNTTFEIWKTNKEYYFVSDNTRWRILTINERSPEMFVFPSLNAGGEPVYILGVLSQSLPEPLMLAATDEYSQTQFEIQLYHSDFKPEDIFREESRGVPIVSIRSFSDHNTDELERFLETAEKYRDEQYLILDIRGNKGGNDYWPEKWVEKFTGQRPEWYFTITRFVSKTILMGHVNWAEQALEMYPEVDAYKKAVSQYEVQVDAFEKTSEQPYWLPDTVLFPYIQLIPNTTTLIVLTDSGIASAGEGFIGYLRQVENVIFVGENTRGAIVFGDVTLYQLPNSKLPVELGSTLNFPADLEIMEGIGFFPDLWIPANCALDYVLEAIKKGTI